MTTKFLSVAHGTLYEIKVLLSGDYIENNNTNDNMKGINIAELKNHNIDEIIIFINDYPISNDINILITLVKFCEEQSISLNIVYNMIIQQNNPYINEIVSTNKNNTMISNYAISSATTVYKAV